MGEWISVDDSLPDYQTMVLAVWRPIDHKERPYHREIVTAKRSIWDENGDVREDLMNWYINGRHYQQKIHITHWMPLPQLPGSGED